MSRWPDECSTWGPIPDCIIEEWKDEVRDKIRDSYTFLYKAADKLHELYKKSDLDKPAEMAEEIDSLIDDLIDTRDSLREYQDELDNINP